MHSQTNAWLLHYTTQVTYLHIYLNKLSWLNDTSVTLHKHRPHPTQIPQPSITYNPENN